MPKKIILALTCFLLAAVATFSLFRFIIFPKLAPEPGELLFSDSVPASDVARIKELTSTLKLQSDLTISRNATLSLNDSFSNQILVDVLLPTTDFYDPTNKISSEKFAELYKSGDPSLVSLKDLDSSKKLLAVDDNYYLDTFSSGAYFVYLNLSSDIVADRDAVLAALRPEFSVSDKLPTSDSLLTLVQTGVTAFGRGLNQKLYQVGDPTYFSSELKPFFSRFDLVHTSSEASLSSSASASNICSDPRFLNTFLDLSIDIIELTGNHNLDCGVDDALSTISLYKENNIRYYGGGENLSDARKPLRLSESDTSATNLTLLGYNESTGGATSGDYPGANPYSEEDAREKISAAKNNGDLVIVDIQYYECNAYDNEAEDSTCDYADSSAGDQISFFRHLIDLGADVVVGTSAHQPQTFERYKDGEIYYGLGNLLFDQYWWPGTTRSLGLVHYLWNGELLQTRRFGTIYDNNLQTRLMTEDEEQAFITRLNSARP